MAGLEMDEKKRGKKKMNGFRAVGVPTGYIKPHRIGVEHSAGAAAGRGAPDLTDQIRY